MPDQVRHDGFVEVLVLKKFQSCLRRQASHFVFFFNGAVEEICKNTRFLMFLPSALPRAAPLLSGATRRAKRSLMSRLVNSWKFIHAPMLPLKKRPQGAVCLMVPLKRFELPTLALRKPCSTTELQRRIPSHST